MSDIRADQLPEFRTWSEQFEPPADTSAYLAREVSITAATILSELFFPELVNVRGCVLLSSSYESSNFEDWWQQMAGDQAAVERVLNHLHLWDIFEPSNDSEEQALDVLAQRIARSWRCWATTTFPDRVFEVTVTDEYGPTVVMHSRTRESQ